MRLPPSALALTLAGFWMLVDGRAVATQSGEPAQVQELRGQEFRRFKGGKDLGGASNPTAIDARLRAEANEELPRGVRVRLRPARVAGQNESLLYRYLLEYEGVPLADQSDYTALVSRRSVRLLASRTRRLPQSVDGTRPTINRTQAMTVAITHTTEAFGQPRSVINADPELEIWVDDHGVGRLAWTMIVKGSGGVTPATVAVRIAAIGSPEVLSAQNLVRFQASIHAQANTWQLSPNQPTTINALGQLTLTPNGFAPVTTDDDGDAAAPFPAGTPVLGLLRGPFARVFHQGLANSSLSRNLVTTGGNDVLDFDATTEFALAQTTAFYWMTYANRWVRGYLPALNESSTLLDELPANTSVSGSCNAFFDAERLYFFRSDNQCNNFATPTIVVHEFGHAVHLALGSIATYDPVFSEGFADALSALVTQQPCLGIGVFKNTETCLRDLTDVTPYPVPSSDPHSQGEPFAQFAWVLAQSVGIDRAAQLILGGVAAAPADIPDAIELIFAIDDDDGDEATCSANQAALQAAADSRQLPRPPDCGVATTLTKVTPSGPANNNSPTFGGTTSANLRVGLFGNSACVGTPLASGLADAAGAFAISLTVVDDSTTTVYAKAFPLGGAIGMCSSGLTYVEDSTPPPAPKFSNTSPASPASEAEPTVNGVAAGANSVKVYRDSCTGNALASGIVSGGQFSVRVRVPSNATTTLVAIAIDAAGNVSSCSAPITYRHVPSSVTITDASAFEGKTGGVSTIAFAVSLTAPLSTAVTVSYATSDGSATVAGNDYRALSGSVRFLPGEVAKTIAIAVNGDGLVEADESFDLRLSVTGAPVLRASAKGTIRNDDSVGVATLTPVNAIAAPQQTVPFTFDWVVPAAKPDGTATNNSWRDLTTMTLRLVDAEGRVAFDIVWHQQSNTFQVRRASGSYGPEFLPGPGGDIQETPFGAVDPAGVIVRTAPGPRVTITVPMLIKQKAAGQTFRVEGAATDDYGDEQPFELLGTLTVAAR